MVLGYAGPGRSFSLTSATLVAPTEGFTSPLQAALLCVSWGGCRDGVSSCGLQGYGTEAAWARRMGHIAHGAHSIPLTSCPNPHHTDYPDLSCPGLAACCGVSSQEEFAELAEAWQEGLSHHDHPHYHHLLGPPGPPRGSTPCPVAYVELGEGRGSRRSVTLETPRWAVGCCQQGQGREGKGLATWGETACVRACMHAWCFVGMGFATQQGRSLLSPSLCATLMTCIHCTSLT